MYTTLEFVKHEKKKLHYCCGYISHYLRSDNCYHQKENPVACYNPELTKGNKYSKKKNIYIYIMCIYILVTKRGVNVQNQR